VALFGIGNEPVIFLIAAAAVWPILINTAAGVHAIDPGYLQVARSFHATRVELLTVVVLPAIRGHLQTGLRVALGIAWVVLVPAEMLGVRSGLGYQIFNARDQLAYGQVVAVIVVIGVIGYTLDLAARRALSGRRDRSIGDS
jgi:NitT/TauT family transport system permease protein